MPNRDVKFAYGDSNGDELRPALTRSALLTAFAEAARSLGLDPYHMLRRAGLPVAALDAPDRLVRVDRVQALLADCARAADSEEFGLLVGRQSKLWTAATYGRPMREQTSVRDALEALRRQVRHQDEYIHLRIAPSAAGGVKVLPLLVSPRTRASRQMTEMTLVMFVQLFRDLLGEAWTPQWVGLAFPAPAHVEPYREILGSVEFGAAHTGFSLTREELAAAPLAADTEESGRVQPAPGGPETAFIERVSALILRLMPEGQCSVEGVAGKLGVDRRTVHRRLAAEGESFGQLLEAARRDVAIWHLGHTDERLGQLPALLGFASPSTFSRWFRGAFGMQPSGFRKRARRR